MNNTNRDRTIALAGMFQAVKLVQQTAQGQRRDAAATAVSISSILNTDPETAIDIFGDSRALIPGLETVLGQMGDDSKQRDMAVTGYVIALMHCQY